MCSIAHTHFVDFSSQYGVRGAVRNRAWPCSGQGFCLRFETHTHTHIQKPCLCLIVFIDFLHPLPIHCSIVHELSFGCTHCVVWGRLWSIFSRFSPNPVYSLLLLHRGGEVSSPFWTVFETPSGQAISSVRQIVGIVSTINSSRCKQELQPMFLSAWSSSKCGFSVWFFLYFSAQLLPGWRI